MRIISGVYKGRSLQGFDILGTRPTQDRVKESLFSMIQGYIPDAVVLDLFAGSGNLGIEALSNGARDAYFVDTSRQAFSIIQKNIANLQIPTQQAHVFHADYQWALSFFHQQSLKFDIVFLDPPYQKQVLDSTLHTLVELELLASSAIIVCEYEVDQLVDDISFLELLKQKKYGYKNIKIYQFKK